MNKIYFIVFEQKILNIYHIKLPRKIYPKGSECFEVNAKESIENIGKFVYALNCNVDLMWNYIHDIKKIW